MARKCYRKRIKKKGESTVGQIIKLFPDQAYEVERWARIWKLPIEEIVTWGSSEFNRRRVEQVC